MRGLKGEGALANIFIVFISVAPDIFEAFVDTF